MDMVFKNTTSILIFFNLMRTLNTYIFLFLVKKLKSVKILPAFSTVLARVFLFGTFIVIRMVFTSVSGKFSVSRWGILWEGTLTEKISEKREENYMSENPNSWLRNKIRQSTIKYAGLLDRWDKRLVDQASDVPSIILFHDFLQNSFQKYFQSICLFF